VLKYLQTTTLILAWCAALSLVLSVAVYAMAAHRHERLGKGKAPLAGVILPALVVAPLALAAAFKLLGWNLLFPVHFFADWTTLLEAALAPALVLVLSSGLAGSLWRLTHREYAHWRGKTFALMATATGQRPEAALRRLVLAKSLCTAWAQCLPWLFGELIIVEAVFNAPGLGLDAWQLAKVRDLAGLGEAILWLAGLYAIAVALTASVNHWLGRRLETYG
jgi:ABC-type dipeptide/oligopeptide/nickel transport system permease component